MILLWLTIGLVLAIAIARMEKSYKLFWAAFTSFAIGIAAESIITKVNQEEEDLTTQVCPTQAVVSTSNYYSFLADVPPTTQSLVPNPVSRDTTPGKGEVSDLPTESFKETLTDPPDYHPKIQK
jgi:hypothetical protein